MAKEFVGCGSYPKVCSDKPFLLENDYPCYCIGYPNIHDNKLKGRFKSFFNRNLSHINRALLILDPMNFGTMKVSELKDILERYCFPFTDDQWDELMEEFTITEGNINYNIFREYYRKNCSPLVERHFQNIAKILHGKKMPRIDRLLRPMIKSIQEIVVSKKDKFLKDFLTSDFFKTGTVTKGEFKRILEKHAFPLTPMQFENVYIQMPMDKKARLIYEEFIVKCSYVEPKFFDDPPPASALLCINPCMDSIAPCQIPPYERLFTYKRPINCRNALYSSSPWPYKPMESEVCPEKRPPCSYDRCYRVNR